MCVLTSVYNVVYDERERGRERGEIFWQGAEQREGSKLWIFFLHLPASACAPPMTSISSAFDRHTHRASSDHTHTDSSKY